MTAEAEEGVGIVPNELDILCGKTKQIISHPGTIRYQRIVESYTQGYIQAESKFDKMSVTKNLYDFLKTTSRFLKFNDKTQCWEEITALAARDKVGHALRFAVNNVGSEKKRMKSKRGHRRTGSDFSAASLTSQASALSTNTNQTANTATSDGGPMVQSLMQALSSNLTFNLSELQGAAPQLGGEHPLGGANNNTHPLRANNNTGNEHPLRATSNTHPLFAPSSNVIAQNSPIANNSPRSSIHSSNASGQAVLQRKISEEDFDFLKKVNESNEADYVGSSGPHSGAPPITEVVTTPLQQKTFNGEFSHDFLSMLHEPIYEFDVEEHDEANEDLY